MAFEGLSGKLNQVFKKLKSHGKLTESDVKEAMREVRMALLEADVSYKVVKDFVNIACHQQRIMPFLFQHLRQLGGMSRLTGALQAAHHDDAGRLGRELDPGVFVAHEITQFLVDDLDL